jgi:protein SCO1/2
VSQQRCRIIMGVVGTMSVVQARAAQAPARIRKQAADRYTARMNRRLTLVFALFALAAALAGVTAARLMGGHGSVALVSGTWLPNPRAVAEFHLQDLSGNDFTLQNLRGHPTLLFFGFTNCPDECPTTLATLAQAQRTMPLPNTQVVFISIDPQRDSAANMAVYLGAFSKDFIGARGDDAALSALLKSLGAIAVRQKLPDGNYTMDHSATLYLLDRQARLAAVFSPPFKSADLTADLHRIATDATL